MLKQYIFYTHTYTLLNNTLADTYTTIFNQRKTHRLKRKGKNTQTHANTEAVKHLANTLRYTHKLT